LNFVPSLLIVCRRATDTSCESFSDERRAAKATLGARTFMQPLQQIGGKITVIVSGRVGVSNIVQLRSMVKATWFHSSAIKDGGETGDKQ